VNICSDVIGYPNRDLPACSAVPQSTALPSEVESHLINGDVQSCTHITSVITFCTSVQERSP